MENKIEKRSTAKAVIIELLAYILIAALIGLMVNQLSKRSYNKGFDRGAKVAMLWMSTTLDSISKEGKPAAVTLQGLDTTKYVLTPKALKED